MSFVLDAMTGAQYILPGGAGQITAGSPHVKVNSKAETEHDNFMQVK